MAVERRLHEPRSDASHLGCVSEVLDHSLKRRVIREGLRPYLKDNENAWSLGADGQYRKRKQRNQQSGCAARRHLMAKLGVAELR